MAASDLGFLLLDTEGNLLARHPIGHAQNLGAGRVRPDLPGRQLIVRTYWGNQGITYLFDCEGNLLLTRETQVGSVAFDWDRDTGNLLERETRSGVVAINWLGDGTALLLGQGLMDGNFETVVELPPGRLVRPMADDVNDDGVDEVLLREGNTLNVYGPETRPASPVPVPKRNLTNWNHYGGFYL